MLDELLNAVKNERRCRFFLFGTMGLIKYNSRNSKDTKQQQQQPQQQQQQHPFLQLIETDYELIGFILSKLNKLKIELENISMKDYEIKFVGEIVRELGKILEKSFIIELINEPNFENDFQQNSKAKKLPKDVIESTNVDFMLFHLLESIVEVLNEMEVSKVVVSCVNSLTLPKFVMEMFDESNLIRKKKTKFFLN